MSRPIHDSHGDKAQEAILREQDDLSKSYRALWTEADTLFQKHRNACSTCRWNPRQHSPTVLCATGRALFDESERLLALANGERK